MLSQLEEFRSRINELSPAFQSVRLGATTNVLDTNSFTAVQPIPREELNRGQMPNLVNGYSSLGFDFNPLDIAYRADTKEEYYQDYGYFLLRVAYSGMSGGSTAAVETGKAILLGYLLD